MREDEGGSVAAERAEKALDARDTDDLFRYQRMKISIPMAFRWEIARKRA
jgi:hypothetical protein